MRCVNKVVEVRVMSAEWTGSVEDAVEYLWGGTGGQQDAWRSRR